VSRANGTQPSADLPVLRAAEEIVGAMRGGSMVLTAATGSGKTTQVPQIMLRSGIVDGEIVVLEPRRLAARMTARKSGSRRASSARSGRARASGS
jgi:ATP-dependent helicase HrpB